MSKKNYFKERIMLLILLFAFMTPFGTLAQTIQLTGLVTDAANEPICTEGPSRPSDNPAETERIPPKNLETNSMKGCL